MTKVEFDARVNEYIVWFMDKVILDSGEVTLEEMQEDGCIDRAWFDNVDLESCFPGIYNTDHACLGLREFLPEDIVLRNDFEVRDEYMTEYEISLLSMARIATAYAFAEYVAELTEKKYIENV